MALPNKTDLQTLDYAWHGQPFADMESKALTTVTLDYAWRAQPFVGAAPAAAGGGPPHLPDMTGGFANPHGGFANAA